jgi:hypothetical protein
MLEYIDINYKAKNIDSQGMHNKSKIIELSHSIAQLDISLWFNILKIIDFQIHFYLNCLYFLVSIKKSILNQKMILKLMIQAQHKLYIKELN